MCANEIVLHLYPSCDNVPTPGMSADWSDKAAWMRREFATEAAWSSDGTLTHLKLGPVVAPDTRETQPSITPQERERREREQRRLITSRSSGGPVMRIEGD